MFNNQNDYTMMDASQASSFMQRVYGWMALALGVSAVTAYTVAASPALFNLLYGNMAVMILLIIAQFGLIFSLQMALPRMSASTAAGVFLAYAVLSGVTLSGIFMLFSMSSIILTFATTAGMFATMAIYGYFTDSDLSSLRSFLFMGLIGLVVANLVNAFIGSGSFDLMIAAFGVMIFTLFTAYDVQMIKRLAGQMIVNHDEMVKVSLIGALKLYLDFVNLFIYLLRFFGHSRRE